MAAQAYHELCYEAWLTISGSTAENVLDNVMSICCLTKNLSCKAYSSSFNNSSIPSTRPFDKREVPKPYNSGCHAILKS